MQLVFGTIQDVDMFYEEFMDMMNFSLKNKSTFFSRWKQRRRIKKFKKQMRLKFQDMEVQMQSLTDFADMLGGVMDSLYIGLDKPKKRKKGDPVSIVTDPVVAELRNAAFGNGSGETGSNVGGSSTGGPNDGSTGGNTGSGTGVDTSGLF
jgi:hypothetical protein